MYVRTLEQAVRDNRARLAGILDSAMDAIVSMDDDQNIIIFNPAAERFFRCPAQRGRVGGHAATSHLCI